jgi:hypothetical protein
MQPSTIPWKLLTFRQLPENKRVSCRKKRPRTTESIRVFYGETFTYASNKLHGMKNVRLDLRFVECCCPFFKRGDLLRRANLAAEVAIELHPLHLPEARTRI